MDKSIIRKLLNELDDREILEMITKLSITLSGFRRNRSPTPLNSLVKQKVINELIQPKHIKKTMKYFREKGTSLTNGIDIKNLEKSEIERLIYKGKISRGHAMIYFYAVGESERAEELASLEYPNQSLIPTEDVIQVKKYKEEPTLVQDLRAIITQLEGKEKDWLKEKENLQLTINQLKVKNKQQEKYWTTETEKLQRKNKILQIEIERLSQDLTKSEKHQKQKNIEWDQQVTLLEKQINALEAKLERIKPSIAVVGEPHNRRVKSTNAYSLTIFAEVEVDDLILNHIEKPFYEIWLLSFRVTSKTMKAIQSNAILANRVIVMDEFSELIDRLEEMDL